MKKPPFTEYPRFPFGCVLFIFLSTAVSSENSSAAAALSGAGLFGSDSRLELSVTMEILENSGKKSRQLAVSLEQSDSGSSLLARVVDPAFLSNLKYLRLMKKNESPRQWLKTSRGVVRVSGTGTGERIFGSHFTAEDFGESSEKDFSFTFGTPEAGIGAVIAAVPRVQTGTYACKDILLNDAGTLIIGVRYYDGNGSLVRSYTVEETWEKNGNLYPKKAVMRDEQKDEMTVLLINSIDRPASFPARLFNPAGM